MALSGKPKRKAASEKEVQAFLQGNLKEADIHEEPKTKKQVEKAPQETIIKSQLRLPGDLKDRIDALRSAKIPRPSRNMWIIEAIAEKLERDERKLEEG